MRVIKTDHFSRQLKSCTKKYRNISADVALSLNAFNKMSAAYLGAKLYKVRVKSSDMKKGKSGAFRVIVLCVEINNMLIPVTIYQKSVQEKITERELEYHLARIREELNT